MADGVEPMVRGPSYDVNLAQVGKQEELPDIMPQMTKAFEATTNLIDNAYRQQLEFAQAKANTAKTLSDVGYFNQATQNMSAQQAQRERLYPLELQNQQITTQSAQYALDDQKRNADSTQAALDDYGSWFDDTKNLDPTAPDYYQKLAEVDAKHRDASSNQATLRLMAPFRAQQETARKNSSRVQENLTQTAQLRAYKEAGFLNGDIDSFVTQGQGEAKIAEAKSNWALARLNNLKENTTDPRAKEWAQEQINNVIGKGFAGPSDKPDPIFDPNGNLLPGTEGKLRRYEQDAGIPLPETMVTGKGAAKTTEPKTTVTRKWNAQTGQWETTQVVTGATDAQNLGTQPPGGRNQQQLSAQIAAVVNDPDYETVYHDTQDHLPKGVEWGSPEAANLLLDNYIAYKNQHNKPLPPGLQTGQQPGQPQTTDERNLPTNVPKPTPAPTPKSQEYIGRRAPQPKPTPEKTIHPKTNLNVGPNPNVPAGVYRKSGQVQEAPSVQLVSTNSDEADADPFGWHNYRMGNSTTFGLNYDGTLDREDNGIGAFGYNTRDPRLVGASLGAPELARIFPNDISEENGQLHVSDRLKQLARNGTVLVQVTDPRSGLSVRMPLVDIGPSPRTGNRLDLTYAASHIFRTQGKSILAYRLITANGQPIET